IIGTIPAALAGFLLEEQIENLFDSLPAVGIALIITGLILLSVNWLAGRKEQRQTTAFDVLLIGIAQVVALIPGISRSGTTIAAGLARGLHRDWAPRFAFLLSAPVILGGTVFQVIRLVQNPIGSQQLGIYLLGGLTAAISGYFAVHLVVRVVRAGNLIYFSGYCILVGIITRVVG
ncbi:MAG: undecaprenyl-diphosphate phosphatase, partial [Armatimonadetes bacterium]|nr:undecaprenyl-diphosphate phosphatase [Armatimonadota bacterium]